MSCRRKLTALRAARVLAVVLCVTVLAPPPLLASQVRLVNLEQMTQRAARIFSGRCTGVDVVFDSNLGRDVTVATFHVQRAVKGVSDKTVMVRMLDVAAVHGAASDVPAGVPTFRPGEEVVLFLYGESAQGLSSPVGLGQGRFRILTDKKGRKVALNDFANSNLLNDLRPETRARLKLKDDPSTGKTAPPQSEEIEPTALLDAAEGLIAKRP